MIVLLASLNDQQLENITFVYTFLCSYRLLLVKHVTIIILYRLNFGALAIIITLIFRVQSQPFNVRLCA